MNKYHICIYIGICREGLKLARNTSISLGEHFDKFISHQVSNGRYGSASEVVRAGLRLLEENETKLILLREALLDGEDSGFGKYTLYSVVAELNEAKVKEAKVSE
jgi:antitoxin ParD1/3/4